jgi:hypothetical protein
MLEFEVEDRVGRIVIETDPGWWKLRSVRTGRRGVQSTQ